VRFANLEEYRALFEGVTDEKAIGETSASFFRSPKAPALTNRSIPDARLVAVLRNPADRACSNFLHRIRTGRVPLADTAEALRGRRGASRTTGVPFGTAS
jgi:hypothetical protein